jgi:hypothetical protein
MQKAAGNGGLFVVLMLLSMLRQAQHEVRI